MKSVCESRAIICPVCGGAEFTEFKFGLKECFACGLVLSQTIWKPQANELLGEEWFGEDYQP